LALLLLLSVFVIATCGLIYELIAGTLASYLLGDSITQFSTIIGCYLFAMGIGSWLSKFINRNLLAYFIKIEIMVGVIGGSAAALLFLLFEHVYSFRLLLYFIVTIIGILVGIEIPLLLRILKDRFDFKDLVSQVFTFDYAGALFASVLFPLLLVPYLGLVKTGFLFGIFNVLVALGLVYALDDESPAIRMHKLPAAVALIALMFAFIYSESIVNLAEAGSYQGQILFAKSTPYQRIVLTKQDDDIRLFLNANLQFSSVDEYRYHEALVHPALAAIPDAKQILIIGGGDGLALREVLKYPSVEKITLVDLDPAMTQLFSSNQLLTRLNRDALRSPKLTVINEDAFQWLRKGRDLRNNPPYDAVIIDLPDPSNFSIGKLYSLSFFKLLPAILHERALVVVQSTSPLVARKSFWCVAHTLAAAGFQTTPYHVYVPSFGEWGFIIGGFSTYNQPQQYPAGLRYVSPDSAREMFHFPADMAEVDTPVQKLDDQILVRYFDQEWSKYLIY
jgi:spermidine synthase